MPKIVNRLTDDENKIFHINYIYMWQKLNTAPYYVAGTGECPEWIKGTELLPSYVNLAKCKNNSYVPSINIVSKIVQFYNQNIEPKVTVFQFIKEDLTQTDSTRHTATLHSGDRFIGTYYGYYYSDLDEKHLNGMIIKLYNDSQGLKATVIAGIKNQAQLYSKALKKLVSSEYITAKEYEAYRSSLDISERKLTLYSGSVRLTDILMLVQMSGIDKAKKSLAMTIRIDNADKQSKYISGLSLATLISDSLEVQMFKIAIARAYEPSLNPLSFSNPKIERFLDFEKGENEHITLRPQAEKSWYELVVDNGK